MALTRPQLIDVATRTRPVGGGKPDPVELPNSGYVALILARLSGAVTGTLSAPNDFGMASILNNIYCAANSVGRIFEMSGQAYHWLYRPQFGVGYYDLFDGNIAAYNANAAVTATNYDISFVLPFQFNQTHPAGLFLTKNKETIVTLETDFLADASVATGATVTGTLRVGVLFYSVPAGGEENQPSRATKELHTVEESRQAISATGQIPVKLPPAWWYLRTHHGLNFGIAREAAAADQFDAIYYRTDQSRDHVRLHPTLMELHRATNFGNQRKWGTITLDWIGFTGLGMLGNAQFIFPSGDAAQVELTLNYTATGTLYSVLDQYRDLSAA